MGILAGTVSVDGHLLSEIDRVGVDGEGWKSSPDYDKLLQQTICYTSSGVTVRHIAASRGAVVANTTCSAPPRAAKVEVLGVAISA